MNAPSFVTPHQNPSDQTHMLKTMRKTLQPSLNQGIHWERLSMAICYPALNVRGFHVVCCRALSRHTHFLLQHMPGLAIL